ncbi:MAG: SPOR domain-containing protein [Thermodesulfobacteriota bacterium]
MSVAKPKKRFLIRFELGIFGLFGLTVVTFCIFLWMFLLGIWAGQTVLQQPEGGSSAKSALERLTSSWRWPGNQASVSPTTGQQRPGIEPARPNGEGEHPVAAEAENSGPSFFVVQVGSFRNAERARQEVEQWKGKGLKAFVVPPEEADDPFTRVYLGKFEKLADANQLVAKLEKEQQIKGYIALLPAAKIKAH